MNPISRRLSHIAKIIFALALAAGWMGVTGGAANAGDGGVGCLPDGQPFAWFSGIDPNATINVIANGQTVGSFKTDAAGNGAIKFGQPGVTYNTEFEMVDQGGRRVAMGSINCPPPAGGGQGDTGQTTPQLQCIEVMPPPVAQAHGFTLIVAQGGTSIQGPAVIHTIALQQPPCADPPSANMQVGEQRTFTATGKDQNGNPYTLSNPTWTTSGGGTLSGCTGTTCTYTATQAGDFTVTVGEGGTTIQGTAPIHTINPQQLTSIEMMPPSANMQVGEQRTFTATGKDQNGQPYPLSNPTWTTSGGGTLAPSGTTCTYTATQAGDFTITVTQGGTGIQGIATIQVQPPETSALTWIIGGVLALGIAAGAGYWLWGRPKV